MSVVATKFQNGSFGELFTSDGESHYSLLVNMFLGYFSLIVYTCLGFILDKVRKSAHHPTSDTLFPKKDNGLTDNKLIVDNLSVVFKTGRGDKAKSVEALKSMNIEFKKH